jgi:hypothetical protein
MDNQTSADTNAFAKSKTTGAMTFCFTLAVESGEARSYASLMDAMRKMLAGNPNEVMANALRSGLGQAKYGVGTPKLAECSYLQANSRVPLPKFSQSPQLTCSQQIDLHQPMVL